MSAVRDVVWALSPCGRPDPDLVLAAGRAEALGLLDLGRDGDVAREALATTAARARTPFGVRIAAGCPVTAADLPEAVDTVVVMVTDADAVVPAIASALLVVRDLDPEALARRDLLRGRRVQVSDPVTGRTLVRGEARGIARDGSLRVRDDGGVEHRVRSGTVRVG